MSTELERIRALEVKMDDVMDTLRQTNDKLDDLLTLKNKGMGAFWLISVLMGAAFTTFVGLFTSWFHG